MTYSVAPPAGAWIETFCATLLAMCSKVAPPAGAWIETTWNNFESVKS